MSREILRDSKNAAAAISVLGGLIALIEGGADQGWQKTANQIIGICKREQQRQLKIMDKADAKLGLPYPKRKSQGANHD